MSVQREPGLTDRIDDPPRIRPSKVREVRGRDLAWRFAAGALTSVVAGVVTLALGARIGGLMLAFPAILAASLTLIEEADDSAEAREDARGAALGGCAMAAFAAVAAIALLSLPGSVALVLATAAWAGVALGRLLPHLALRPATASSRPAGPALNDGASRRTPRTITISSRSCAPSRPWPRSHSARPLRMGPSGPG